MSDSDQAPTSQTGTRADTRRRATMADVGRLARVSATTVSFVINNRLDETISDETRKRVLAAVEELEYRPNLAAQSLRTRRTRTIGFVTDEIAVVPPAGLAIAGAHDAAHDLGNALVIAHANRDPARITEAIEELVHRQVDAIVYLVIGTGEIALPPSIHRIPTVLVNGFNDGVSSVVPDDEQGARDATDLLISAGHERIAYITGERKGWATRQRLRGYRSAMRSTMIAVDPELVLHGNFRPDSGYDLTHRLLDRHERPTALLCGNDLMAVGAYFALKEAGLRVPEDISVIGYDDHDQIAPYLQPALTTVRLPYYEMGRWAVERLVAGKDTTDPDPITTLPCPLIPRASVGPPPRTNAE